MPSLGPLELGIILVIALLVLGPKKLPDAGRAIGEGLREFKDSIGGKNHRAEEIDPPRESRRYCASSRLPSSSVSCEWGADHASRRGHGWVATTGKSDWEPRELAPGRVDRLDRLRLPVDLGTAASELPATLAKPPRGLEPLTPLNQRSERCYGVSSNTLPIRSSTSLATRKSAVSISANASSQRARQSALRPSTRLVPCGVSFVMTTR